MNIAAPLLIGFAFGWVLQKGKLGRYETIVGVFRLIDLTVLQFLVTALMVAMLGNQALLSLGLAETLPVAQTYALGNLGGGLVFGAAMALAGFCPGTVAAGAGEGRLDYLVPGSLGLYAGAVLYGLVYPSVMPAIVSVGNLGTVTATRELGVSGWLLVVLFWELGCWLLYAVRRGPFAPRTLSSSA